MSSTRAIDRALLDPQRLRFADVAESRRLRRELAALTRSAREHALEATQAAGRMDEVKSLLDGFPALAGALGGAFDLLVPVSDPAAPLGGESTTPEPPRTDAGAPETPASVASAVVVATRLATDTGEASAAPLADGGATVRAGTEAQGARETPTASDPPLARDAAAPAERAAPTAAASDQEAEERKAKAPPSPTEARARLLMGLRSATSAFATVSSAHLQDESQRRRRDAGRERSVAEILESTATAMRRTEKTRA